MTNLLARLGVWRGHPFYAVRTSGDNGLRESDARGSKDQEQFAGPEQNIEQSRALEIGEVSAMQADLEGLLRALFDEGAHGGEIHALFAGFLAARINVLQLRVAPEQKMVQAKILAIQGSSRGAVTSILAAVSFRKVRIHRAHTS